MAFPLGARVQHIQKTTQDADRVFLSGTFGALGEATIPVPTPYGRKYLLPRASQATADKRNVHVIFKDAGLNGLAVFDKRAQCHLFGNIALSDIEFPKITAQGTADIADRLTDWQVVTTARSGLTDPAESVEMGRAVERVLRAYANGPARRASTAVETTDNHPLSTLLAVYKDSGGAVCQRVTRLAQKATTEWRKTPETHMVPTVGSLVDQHWLDSLDMTVMAPDSYAAATRAVCNSRLRAGTSVVVTRSALAARIAEELVRTLLIADASSAMRSAVKYRRVLASTSDFEAFLDACFAGLYEVELR